MSVLVRLCLAGNGVFWVWSEDTLVLGYVLGTFIEMRRSLVLMNLLQNMVASFPKGNLSCGVLRYLEGGSSPAERH